MYCLLIIYYSFNLKFLPFYFKPHCQYWVMSYLKMKKSLSFIIFIKNLNLNYIAEKKIGNIINFFHEIKVFLLMLEKT